MKRLVIFDLDGTLLNTIEDLGRAANYALEVNGYPTHSVASYPFFVGNGVRKLIERVLPEDINKDMVIDKMLSDFKTYYNEHKHRLYRALSRHTRHIGVVAGRGCEDCCRIQQV